MLRNRKFLKELRDRQEIHDELLRYCRGTDRLDVDLVSGSFHDDAKVVYSTFTALGKDVGPAVLDVTKNKSGNQMAMHTVMNHLIELDGNTANSETYFVMWGRSEKEDPEMLEERGGRYLDRWEKRSGQWKISERRIIWDWRRSTEMPQPFRENAGNTIGYRTTEDASYDFLPQRKK